MANSRFGGLKKSLNAHKTSFRDFAAHTVVERTIDNIITERGPLEDRSRLPQAPGRQAPAPDLEQLPRTDLPIGIIGAGTAGLYAAMILQSLNIDYEILESNDRIGGRIHTHRFNGEEGWNAEVGTAARYDYFDVGAMRYPRIPFMDRVFDLFTRININDLLIEYHLKGPNNLMYYNTQPPLNPTIHTAVKPEDDYFRVSAANDGTVPNDYMIQSPGGWAGDVYQFYKDIFGELDDVPEEDRPAKFQEAWDMLTSQDYKSTRGYMLTDVGRPITDPTLPSPFPPPFPPPVIEWLETYDSATGLYDQAFVESVIDSLDFDWPNPHQSVVAANKKGIPPASKAQKTRAGKAIEEEWEWVCIDGGSDRMTYAMNEQLNKKPLLNRRVNRMSVDQEANSITVAFDRTKDLRHYAQVICTAPLGCLAAIDTDGLDLLYNQKLAIRALQYDASTKVGLKFAKRWWEDPAVMGSATIQGGQSTTDLPIRVCVYPSYGIGVTDVSGVMIASYTWAQDARRLGGLALGKGTPSDDELIELTLNNVAKLHGVTREQMGPLVDHFAHSWFNDPHARGAFGLFGPAQFGSPNSTTPSLFTAIKTPGANGKFHIAGEATSAHHAWVLGSLNSAWRSVYNALEGQPAKQQELIDKWGIPDEESEVLLKKLSLVGRYHLL